MVRRSAQFLLRQIMLIAAAAFVGIAPFAASAQNGDGPATLIADLLEITGENTLTATGNVEVVQDGYRLMAQRIYYNRASNQLQIDGPLTFDDGVTTTILGDAADLSADMRNGIITGAQVIIDGQLQLAAGALQRVDGRYNTMHQVAASSCKICQDQRPLWEIRAKRVIHDVAEKQIYFDQAQFRLGGVPIFYLPRLRLADPTLTRATGFLVPKAELTSSLGFGLKIPYFIAISRDKDLLITPYLSSNGNHSVDLRYRQAFRTGNVTVNAEITPDATQSGKLRSYFLATGEFQLPQRYKLRLRGETINGTGFFRGYGLAEQDRFVTSAQIDRTNRDSYVQGRVLGFYSVRRNDNNATQPSQIADFESARRFDLGQLGEGQITFYGAARQRASTDPFDGTDADTAADGRDVRGFGVRGELSKSAVLPFGILAKGTLALRADSYRVEQDVDFAGDYRRGVAALAAELRWPLLKSGTSGGMHSLEPIAQLVLAPPDAQRLFNEDSALVEFDEGNLFAINRFPGSDRIEVGSRANMGVNYAYSGPNGRRGQLTIGRVISTTQERQFALASGLGQRRSDWLVAGQLDMNKKFGFTVRSLFENTGDVRKLELRGAATGKNNSLTVGYLFAPADADEQRSGDISEITLDASQKLSSAWKGSLSARYDAAAQRVSKSGADLSFRNECLQMNVSLSRNYSVSTTVADNTVFAFSIALLGFGGQSAGVASQCRG